MSFYWVYALPDWLFAVLCTLVFVAVGLLGLYATRGWVQRLHVIDHSHNDIVGFYFAAVTVFYGITLGLLAVGTWTTYAEVEDKVDHEAAALGALYRDISVFPEPLRSKLQQDLRSYARQVIDVGWPLQRRGIVPNNAGVQLKTFQDDFMEFEPTKEREKIAAAEAYRAYNELSESRSARLNSVTEEMPGPLWTLVVVGALICIASTWFFHARSFGMHFWMTVLFSGLLGLMLYLIAVLDNPYRGELSVSPEPLEQTYRQIMTQSQ